MSTLPAVLFFVAIGLAQVPSTHQIQWLINSRNWFKQKISDVVSFVRQRSWFNRQNTPSVLPPAGVNTDTTVKASSKSPDDARSVSTSSAPAETPATSSGQPLVTTPTVSVTATQAPDNNQQTATIVSPSAANLQTSEAAQQQPTEQGSGPLGNVQSSPDPYEIIQQLRTDYKDKAEPAPGLQSWRSSNRFIDINPSRTPNNDQWQPPQSPSRVFSAGGEITKDNAAAARPNVFPAPTPGRSAVPRLTSQSPTTAYPDSSRIVQPNQDPWEVFQEFQKNGGSMQSMGPQPYKGFSSFQEQQPRTQPRPSPGASQAAADQSPVAEPVPMSVSNDRKLKQELAQSGNGLVLIYFFIVPCNACTRVPGMMQSLASDMKGVKYIKANADSCTTSSAGCNEDGTYPCFVFMKGGKQVDVIGGIKPDEMKKALQKYK